MLVTSVLTFRALSAALAAAVMVPLALLWLLGVMEVLDWRLNFFNVIALPLLVGMGEDASLHVLARWREEGSARVGVVLRETGGAIAMTAWTTICGFGAILGSAHRGLRSLAWVSVTGVVLVFVASVVVLPALVYLHERWVARRRS
jgi:predicted RND superfamily exporter protein